MQYNNIRYYCPEHRKPRKLSADAQLPSIVIENDNDYFQHKLLFPSKKVCDRS